MREGAPFKLIPAGKDYLWGGMRLKEEFGKDFGGMHPIAESWECSTHPDGMSRAAWPAAAQDALSADHGADGEDCRPGTADPAFPTLREVLLRHPGYLGTHPHHSMPEAASRGELPVLVKFIDAAQDLSVQVHPDDAYAREHENGQTGKSEMWYVLDADEDAAGIVYGFRRDMTPETVRQAIAGGRLENCLQRVPVRRDDVFFVQAGTVHAIGAGTMIVEVQESSNLTYRIYDYHRRGADGRERTLHIDKALQVMSYQAAAEPRQPMRVLRYRPGCACELLCRCRYFEVRRLLIRTEGVSSETHTPGESVTYRTDATSFHVLVCIGGSAVLAYSDMTEGDGAGVLEVSGGDTVFVPADSCAVHIRGNAAFLDVNC